MHRRFRYNHWRLGRVPEGASVDANPGAFDSAIAARYGDKATDTINAAEAALNAMPPEGKAWVQNTLKALDAETEQNRGQSEEGLLQLAISGSSGC